MEKLSTFARLDRIARRQRGDILLVTMVFLLVCLLGLVVSTREGIVSTLMGGNNLARQRDVQVADVAVREMENQIQMASGGVDLRSSVVAFSQPWLRIPAGTTAPAPNSAYWDACLGNSDPAARCGAVPTASGAPAGYPALAVVQYTGRSDPYSCQTTGSNGQPEIAFFYDVFIHLKEANGVTSSTTETVYLLCTN